MEQDAGLHTAPLTRDPGLRAPTPIQRPWRGLPAVLPVGGQGGMVIAPMGSAWPLGGLETGEELTAGNLMGGDSDGASQSRGSAPLPRRAPFPQH